LQEETVGEERLPSVIFLCVHNAGRSQMAAALFERHARGAARAFSGGSHPAAEVHPLAVQALHEVGIDIAGRTPARWTDDLVRDADVVVTMGCGDSCPYFPGVRYEDWEVGDPAGQDLEAVRDIRDDIDRRVRALVGRVLGTPA
jgi:protein-tyrosine-phosphatase